MSIPLVYSVNAADAASISGHLKRCDAQFMPPLSSRLNIQEYGLKLETFSTRFEAWSNNELIGLVAAYFNVADLTCFISNVSVEKSHLGNGIASRLMGSCLERARTMGFSTARLEVHAGNSPAIALYARLGFAVADRRGDSLLMALGLDHNEALRMTDQRDYNAEARDACDHKYVYGFDFDVMHPFMVRSFEPFFRPGTMLELGSFRGDFTLRLMTHFDDITCVEASDEAIGVARKKTAGNIEFVHGRFEDVRLPSTYDNIVLTHVLEHLDDPVAVLERVNREWLSEKGRLFLACPNANAPSRQIAVKMGLITHNAAVTAAEAQHGHRCTYTLDTLERDAVAAGLRVIHRSGIFFKALANFQWDRLLQTDIISPEYLEGCFKLGQLYPDLCSSIFLVCERRDKAHA